MNPATAEQPTPTGDGPEVWPMVIADMHARAALGKERYGTPLRAFNGRDQLTDAYQEGLDRLVYMRAAMVEWDAMRAALRSILAHCDSPWQPTLGVIRKLAADALNKQTTAGE